MRGYGAPHAESATSELTRPDWGWGDAAPSAWNNQNVDYGWGSPRIFAFSPYLLTTERIGDDGGYSIEIRGTFPRLGASARQRPTGYTVKLSDNQTTYVCYSGRAGNKNTCSTDLRGEVLRAYSPQLNVGTYTVSFEYENTSVDVGSMIITRRMRTDAEYALKSALPSIYQTGARTLEVDPLLDTADPRRSTLDHLLRAFGQSLSEFSQSGVLTRLTADLAPSASTLSCESTLGMPTTGAVFVGGVLISYTGRTDTTLTGLTRPLGQLKTISRGSRIEHDTHTIAN